MFSIWLNGSFVWNKQDQIPSDLVCIKYLFTKVVHRSFFHILFNLKFKNCVRILTTFYLPTDVFLFQSNFQRLFQYLPENIYDVKLSRFYCRFEQTWEGAAAEDE